MSRIDAGALDRPFGVKVNERLSREQTMDHEKPLVEQSDEELVLRCLEHDHGAFTELVDRYKHRIHRLVRRMVGSPDDEDLTQEVFLRVYRALPRFRSGSRFSTWIYKIAHNLCLSELRKRGRRGRHLSFEEEGEEKVHWLLSDTRENLEEQIERRDVSRRVQELVEQLPVRYRTVLTLFYVHQTRYEEIAEIMNLPMGTVKTHIRRARARLRNLVLAHPDLAGLVDEPAPDTVADGGQSG